MSETVTEITADKDCGGPVIWCVADTGLCTRCHASRIPLDQTESKPLWPARSGESLASADLDGRPGT
jgi:hypothetical protein